MEIYTITCEWEDEKIIMGNFQSYEKALNTLIRNVDGELIEIQFPAIYELEYNPGLILKILEYWEKDNEINGIKYHYEIIKSEIE